jgi:hypothetical protein
MYICYACGHELQLIGRPGRSDLCPSCSASIHCCRNCRYHNPGAHNQCREPQAEWVRDREGANFCDYFEMRKGRPDIQTTDRAARAKQQLEELFRAKGGEKD